MPKSGREKKIIDRREFEEEEEARNQGLEGCNIEERILEGDVGNSHDMGNYAPREENQVNE